LTFIKVQKGILLFFGFCIEIIFVSSRENQINMGWLTIILMILLSCCISDCKKAELSTSLSLLYGPGLQTNVVLPVRYFYIQAVTSKGKK